MLLLRIHICLLLLFCSAAWLSAQQQPYEVLSDLDFGGSKADEIHDLIENFRGGYVAVGETRSKSEGGKDILFLVTGKQMEPLVQKPIGGSGDDGAYAVVQTFDGAYVMAGYSRSKRKEYQGGYDAILLKVDESGKNIWFHSYGTKGQDIFRDVIQLPDGTFAVSGQKDGRFWLARISANGDKLLWEQVLPTPGESGGMSLVLTRSGQLLATGYSEAKEGRQKSELMLVKTDLSGKAIFVKSYTKGDVSKGMSVIETRDGAYAVAGTAYSEEYREDMALLETDTLGTLLFARPYGNTGNDGAKSIVQDYLGDLLITGYTYSHQSAAKRPNLWLKKVNPQNGGSRWKDEYYLGGKQSDEGNKVMLSERGEVIVAGYSNRLNKGNQAWIVRLDAGYHFLPAFPADVLVGQAQFVETDFNAELNPEERCYLRFVVSNNSKMGADGFVAHISLTDSVAGVQYYPEVVIGHLEGGEQRVVTIPVTATRDLKPGTATFAVQVNASEKAVGNFQIKIKTNTVPEPDLEIENGRFITANGKAPERGDTISFAFTMHNRGNKMAENVIIRMNVPGEVWLLDSTQLQLGTVMPYQSNDIFFHFVVRSLFVADTVSANCTIEEASSAYGASGRYTLVLGESLYVLPDSLRHSKIIRAFWTDEFQRLNGQTLKEKEIVLRTVVVSDKPVDKENVQLLVNENPLSLTPKKGSLVLLQSENNMFIYKLYYPLTLARGDNQVEVKVMNPVGTARTDIFKIAYQPDPPNLYVYSIGVPLPESGLQYHLKDAADIAGIFSKARGDFYHKINVQSYTTEEQTDFTSLNRLFVQLKDKQLRQEFNEKDILIMYIASQASDKTKGAFKIKASDYDGFIEDYTAVDYVDVVQRFLSRINCHKLLILDVFSEKQVRDLSAPTELEEENAGEEGATLSATLAPLLNSQDSIITLMACGSGESGYEDTNWQNSALVKALKEAFDPANQSKNDLNQDRELSVSELYAFLRKRVPELVGGKKPKPKTMQTPFIPQQQLLNDFDVFGY